MDPTLRSLSLPSDYQCLVLRILVTLQEPCVAPFLEGLCALSFPDRLRLQDLLCSQLFEAQAYLIDCPSCGVKCRCPACDFLHTVCLLLTRLELESPLSWQVVTPELLLPFRRHLRQALLCVLIHLGHVPFLLGTAIC